MKFGFRILLAITLAALLTACGKKEEDPNLSAIIAISLTQTAAAPQQPAASLAASSPTAPAPTGTISGTVHLMAPPTPHMTVYALDAKTGLWTSVETAPADGPVPFSLVVSPGSYQVYAFTDDNGFVGYSADGNGLTAVNVAANQTVADVNVSPPSQFECGSTYGVPASPDNRFKAVPGPSQSCQATVEASNSAQAANTGPQRIQFAPGASSSRTQEIIPATGRQYVLSAMAGQEMTVNLMISGDQVPSPVFFVIRGANGSALAPSEQRLTHWTGVLPSTQDYYIDLVSVYQVSVDCTLDVAISAIHSSSQNSRVFPKVIPAGFESIAGLSQNVMLPAQFPATSGLPTQAPYVLWADNGDYDISLDYGTDCRSAGACHYGSLSAKKIYSSDFESTPNFVYEPGRAKNVSLANGIPGSYLEGLCGASCDDGRMFWVYDGHQYMIGLKGAPENAVIDLANAAITNSVP